MYKTGKQGGVCPSPLPTPKYVTIKNTQRIRYSTPEKRLTTLTEWGGGVVAVGGEIKGAAKPKGYNHNQGTVLP